MIDPDSMNNKRELKREYQSIVLSPSQAVARIKPGQRVFIGTGCGQPQILVQALMDRADELDDVEIVHLLTLGDPPFLHRELAEKFHINNFFISDNVPDAQRKIRVKSGNIIPTEAFE